ncbi:lipoate--protein ligase [Caloranaerobacter sp. DY30410]|uniref:lipoate--protein ligase n=1 Tax=Caloranaerobacter sp. DY30410 TaxID=3238305 RepID=UPI003D000330
MSNKKVATKIIQSLSFDPWYNLALEEYLLNKVSENQMILYLWQNENTVVIGRNQNPWKECRCSELENEGGKLARRLSGGGAVFHDLGNLNFTFIMDKKLYNLENQLKIILRAVRKLGIEAEFSGRNDLTVQGKKFSGNAFYFDTNSAYHHGTLLINTDFEKLNRYLQVSKEKLNSKGVDSVQSRVVNLSSIKNSITIEDMVKSLEESFIEFYGETTKEFHQVIFTKDVEKLYHKYASWEWRYGETPSFDITFRNRFSWGDIDIGLKLENGYIKSSVIYSDAIEYNLIQEISRLLEGIPFCKENIISRIESISTNSSNRTIIEDLKRWFSTKNI